MGDPLPREQLALRAVQPCWCGEKDPWRADFESGLSQRCDGAGTLSCHCGGDLCVCHNHDEVECPGCAECEDLGDEDDTDQDHWTGDGEDGPGEVSDG